MALRITTDEDQGWIRPARVLTTGPPAASVSDTHGMSVTANGSELSLRQQEFAERMDCAFAVPCGDQSVCLYRVVEHDTIRWIVAVDGSVLDWTVFHSRVSAPSISSFRDGAASSPRAAA